MQGTWGCGGNGNLKFYILFSFFSSILVFLNAKICLQIGRLSELVFFLNSQQSFFLEHGDADAVFPDHGKGGALLL